MKKLLYIVAVLAFAGCNTINKKNKMTPSRYIVAFKTSQGNNETMQQKGNDDLWLEVFNVTRGIQIYGSQNDRGSIQLHILPASKKSRQELTDQLKAVRDVRSVFIVELSDPIKEPELAEVRKLLAGIELDAGKISNDALALFIEDKLQGEYKYVIQMDRRRIFEVPAAISIIRTEDLPGITREMLKDARKEMMDLPDRPLTKDDFEMVTQEVILE
ncbi:MAG TPA: hypothetical protein VF622_03315, partial [Segetibacter sp.]